MNTNVHRFDVGVVILCKKATFYTSEETGSQPDKSIDDPSSPSDPYEAPGQP